MSYVVWGQESTGANGTRHDSFQDLQCMSFTAKGIHELVVAGGQDTMFKIDSEKGTITQVVSFFPLFGIGGCLMVSSCLRKTNTVS
jgi:hypothetical protein